MQRAGRDVLLTAGVYARRYLYSFSVVILVVYTLKDAGTILLAGYTQRKPTARSDTHDVFVPTHLVMCVEMTKLLMSLVWCASNVTRRPPAASVDRSAGASTHHRREASACVSASGVQDDGGSSHATAVRVADVSATRAGKYQVSPKTSMLSQSVGQYNINAWLHAYVAEVTAHGNMVEILLMAVPAVTYAVQNFLFIYALKMLNPSIFQLLYQLRIPLTALLMRVMLHTHITPRKWLAIVLLCVGVSATQLTATSKSDKPRQPTSAQATNDTTMSVGAASSYFVGLLATLAACFVSSATSVFMELVFKHRTVHCTLATRNVHLSFFSILWLLLVSVGEYYHGDKNNVSTSLSWSEYWRNYLRGFTGLVWLLVFLQAVGGILVALVMKYADNILKSFCNAIAIVAVGIASVFIFDFSPTVFFIGGSILVLLAITLYNA